MELIENSVSQGGIGRGPIAGYVPDPAAAGSAAAGSAAARSAAMCRRMARGEVVTEG